MKPLETDLIQGMLFRGFRGHRYASFLLLRMESAADVGGWVESLLRKGLIHFGAERPADDFLQLAFSSTGMAALGDDGALDTFAPPFREGMTSPLRQRILGDTGANAPDGWEWGGPDDVIDVLLALYSRGEEGDGALSKAHEDFVQRERERAAGRGLVQAYAHSTTPLPPAAPGGEPLREHFGFADGISQPVFEGWKGKGELSAEERRLHVVPSGEFVLGQVNAYRHLTPVPELWEDAQRSFGRNGSYLVLRQLSQDVPAFWEYFDGEGGDADPKSDPSPGTKLAAKAVGRWPDGSPLVTCPVGPDPGQATRNDFDFRSDPDGMKCPVGSHVRRTYPRDSKEVEPEEAISHANTHRILRRGRSYGEFAPNPREAKPARRGLFFVCLCANPERQFEFVQQTWVNNEAFDGLQGERDPIVAPQPAAEEGGGAFSIPQQVVRRRLTGLPQFVTVRGGAYFFLPGRNGLDQLVTRGR